MPDDCRFDESPFLLELFLVGDPVSKGRPRFGRGGHVYTPNTTVQAEKRIANLVRESLTDSFVISDDLLFRVEAQFFCAGWQRRDIDNLLKLDLDALNGVLWVDDAQVVEVAAVVERDQLTPYTHLEISLSPGKLHPSVICETCGSEFRVTPSQLGRRFCRECPRGKKKSE